MEQVWKTNWQVSRKISSFNHVFLFYTYVSVVALIVWNLCFNCYTGGNVKKADSSSIIHESANILESAPLGKSAEFMLILSCKKAPLLEKALS
jgi:hypothetical protein